MTKLKCDECGEKNDRMHVVVECSKCYLKGFEEERRKIIDMIKGLDFLSHKNRKTIINKIKGGTS